MSTPAPVHPSTSLTGLAALVTGASRGIGAAVAHRLAAEGADVAVTYRSDAEGAERTAEAVRALGRRAAVIRADAADPADAVRAVEEAAAALGRLDILVNNAGVFPFGPFQEVSVEEFDRTLAIHARAPFLAAQAAVKHMADDGTGRIVTIGSNLAERSYFPGIALYTLSKAAVDGLTRGLARDLGPRRITVNTVHPGNTDTEMNPAGGANAGAQVATTALGRYNTPEDVAASVAHLAGPSGRQITGTAITVDAGTNI